MKFGFFYWAPGEPSIANPSQATTRDCIDIYRTGKWNDRPCDYYTSFVCEKNATKWSDSSVRVYFFNGFSYPNLLILMSISEFNKNIPRTPVPGNHNYFSDSNSLRKFSGSLLAHIGARFLINRVLLYLLSKTKMIKIINLKVVFLCITLNIFTNNFTECSKMQYTKIHLY